MTLWDIDLVHHRVGPFFLGQHLSFERPLTNIGGRKVEAEEIAYIEPSRDIVIELQSFDAPSGSFACRVIAMVVDDTSEVTLCGVPLREVSLSQTLQQLAAHGVTVVWEADTLLRLSIHVTLGVFDDRIDKIIIGPRGHWLDRECREINDPSFLRRIVDAASSSITAPHNQPLQRTGDEID